MLDVLSTQQSTYLLCTSSTPLTPSKIALVELAPTRLPTDDAHTTTATAAQPVVGVADALKRYWKSPWAHKPRFCSISSKVQFPAPQATTTLPSEADKSMPTTITAVPSGVENPLVSVEETTDKLLGKINGMRWKVVEYYAPGTSLDSTSTVEVSGESTSGDNTMSRRFEAILMLPPEASHTDTDSIPLIVVPHGGPHSCIPTLFLPSYIFLSITINAAILLVNYRGSSGFGQRSIDSLPGHIGDHDVADMVQSINDVHTYSIVDGKQIVIDSKRYSVVGGSHGGFLGAHLIGQHPDLFASAVLRNPVTNIPTMTTFSDIPDWCYIESMGDKAYDFTTFPAPTADDFARMYGCSPIAHIDKVKTPVLLCLGGMYAYIIHLYSYMYLYTHCIYKHYHTLYSYYT